MSIFDIIKTELQQQQALPFDVFMQLALYAPEYGYYQSHSQKLGSSGDFITAPEMTPLFAQALANQCQQILVGLSTPIIFEFGAGSGQLCIDLLSHLARLNCLPQAYHILEISGSLRKRQQNNIAEKIPHLMERIKWLDSWPSSSFEGCIIANEVLDAMPVNRFMQTKEGLFEIAVTLDATENLCEVLIPCNNIRLSQHVQEVLTHDVRPYQSEVNLYLDGWLKACAKMLTRGAFFLIDYGFPRHEFYHPERNQGTLMCHYRHRAHPNPYLYLGEQDITAHVDFTHVAEAADAAGFHVAGYTNQASFLLGNDLLSLLSAANEIGNIQHQQAVKQLLQPDEMGELFKVIALTKQMALPLQGFQWHDKRASLSLWQDI